jgi:hypothetical protein
VASKPEEMRESACGEALLVLFAGLPVLVGLSGGVPCLGGVSRRPTKGEYGERGGGYSRRRCSSHRDMRRACGSMVESGSMLDVVIRGAVKAVEAMASAGTRDMLGLMCYEPPLARADAEEQGQEPEAGRRRRAKSNDLCKLTSSQAETVIKMTETSQAM